MHWPVVRQRNLVFTWQCRWRVGIPNGYHVGGAIEIQPLWVRGQGTDLIGGGNLNSISSGSSESEQIRYCCQRRGTSTRYFNPAMTLELWLGLRPVARSVCIIVLICPKIYTNNCSRHTYFLCQYRRIYHSTRLNGLHIRLLLVIIFNYSLELISNSCTSLNLR